MTVYLHLQEGAKEVSDLRRDLELLAGESVELRGALQEEHRKRKVGREVAVLAMFIGSHNLGSVMAIDTIPAGPPLLAGCCCCPPVVH